MMFSVSRGQENCPLPGRTEGPHSPQGGPILLRPSLCPRPSRFREPETLPPPRTHSLRLQFGYSPWAPSVPLCAPSPQPPYRLQHSQLRHHRCHNSSLQTQTPSFCMGSERTSNLPKVTQQSWRIAGSPDNHPECFWGGSGPWLILFLYGHPTTAPTG